jgi:regulatory protein
MRRTRGGEEMSGDDPSIRARQLDRGGAERNRAGRAPRKVDAAYLEKAALDYLGRFASSSANLRRVLLRKVRRSAEAHGTDPGEGTALIDALVARYTAAGLLNDDAYARARAATLHRRGVSSRTIRGKLAQKGIGEDAAAAALDELGGGPDALDLVAACHFVRRRRLGCCRRSGDPAASREKDLAALGRAGFALDLARRVLACRSEAELEALLDE